MQNDNIEEYNNKMISHGQSLLPLINEEAINNTEGPYLTIKIFFPFLFFGEVGNDGWNLEHYNIEIYVA